MTPTEGQWWRASTPPHVPPMAAARTQMEPDAIVTPRVGHIPGDFVSAQYASDCARFVAEAKRLARCRSERLNRPATTFGPR